MFSHVLLGHSDSIIFEKTKSFLEGVQKWWDRLPDIPYASYFHDTAYWAIIIILLYFIFVFLRKNTADDKLVELLAHKWQPSTVSEWV